MLFSHTSTQTPAMVYNLSPNTISFANFGPNLVSELTIKATAMVMNTVEYIICTIHQTVV